MRRHWTRIGLVVACVVAMAGMGLLGVAGAAPGDGPVTFAGGLAVVEAEDHDAKVARSSHDWVTAAGPAGALGVAIQAAPDNGARITASIPTTSPEVGYRVSVPAAGTYQLWVRASAVSNGNTFHAGRDGQVTAQGLSAAVGSWTWVKTAMSIPSAGEHTVQLWMREDGLHVDRLLLAQSASFTPSGTGPAVTPRQSTGPDLTPPTLTGRTPSAGATGVAPGADVVATFSEAMNAATLTGSTFTLTPTAGGPALSATVSPSAGNTVATLDPAADLAPSTSYTATVAGSVADAAGNPMGAPQTWTFTTAAAAPEPAPGAVLFASGLAVVEAEDADAKVPRASHDWVAGQSPAGSVAAALKAAPDNGARINAQIPTTSPELAYRVHFPAAGTYQLWLRTFAVANGNTFHAGRDGQVTSNNVGAPVGSWTWVKQAFAVPTAGEHTVHVWMREDGINLDRLLLAQSASFTPTGTGPAVTGRQPSADTTRPTLATRQPAPGATGVAVGANVVATFSEAMNPATLTGSTFTLAPTAGGPAVSATVTGSAGNTTFTLNPSADLAVSTSYTATVTTGATDAAGNPVAAQQTWAFTTAAAPDTTPPTLTGRQPAPGATGVAIGADVVATFSEAMNPATLSGTTFTLAPTAGGPAVSATIAASAGNTAFTLNPSADLAFSTSYTATVTTGATDAAGNPIAAQQTWAFTTAAAPDTTAPTLTGRQPAPGATGVLAGTDVVATFSEAMNPATLTGTTFTLAPTAGGPAVTAAIAASAGNTVFTLNPSADLAFSTSYTATVTTGATDAAGNPIAAQQTWAFTTAAAPDTTAPTLTGRQPAPGAIDISAGASVLATFSEAMDPATVTTSTFTLAPSAGGSAVAATVTASAGNTVFTLDPAADLAPGTAYTATVATGATDVAGNPLAAAQSWSFTTVEEGAGDGAILFQNDMAVIEAEDPDVRTPRSARDWVPGQSPAGSVGDAMQAAPDTGAVATGDIVSTSAELAYRVQFPAAGTYYLWLRGYAPDGSGNSVHTGLDGAIQAASDALSTNTLGTWTWFTATLTPPGSAAVSVPSAGVHTVHVWLREDGLHLDRILLTPNPTFTPSGQGPPASPRDATGADATPPALVETQPAAGASGVPVGANLVATFSEPMDPDTLTSASVTVSRSEGGPAVAASLAVSPGGETVTIDPAQPLLPSTAYTVRISTAASDLAGNELSPSAAWSFTTGPAPGDGTAPTIATRAPAPGATDVLADAEVAVTFSEPMNPATLTSSTLRLIRSAGGAVVPASIAASGGNTTFTLDPAAELAAGATYTVEVGAEARDAAGNPLAAPSTWSFTTAQAPGGGGPGPVLVQGGQAAIEAEDYDARIPRSGDDWVPGQSPAGSVGDALQVIPDNGSGAGEDPTATSPELAYRVLFPAAGRYFIWVRGYAPDGSSNSVNLGLDGAMQATSDAISTSVFGSWVWFAQSLNGPGPAAVDVPSAGEHTLHVWMREDGFHLDRLFLTTAANSPPAGNGPPASPRADEGADTTPPSLVDRAPAAGATNAPQGSDVVASFSEPIDPTTVNASSVRLAPAAGGAPVAADVSLSPDGRSAILDPTALLQPGTAYRATVTTAVEDLHGNALAAERTWTFTTRVHEQYEPEDGRIYSGVSTRGTEENLDAFLAVSEQPSVAIHNRFNRRGDPSGFRVILDDLEEQGLTGMISWSLFEPEFYSPTVPGANHASIARGDLDAYILDRAAEVRAYGQPLFIRLHHEMNHDFFPWGAFDQAGNPKPNNSHADFRSSWRRAVILFRGGSRAAMNAALAAVGLPGLATANASVPATPNVAWVWTPASGSSHPEDDVHAYWPGDAYVDWAGVDWYPFGTADAGHHAARAGAPGGPNELYERYSGPASTSSKPFMLGEWGVFGMDRPNWTADMFAWFETHPQVKGQLYFNIASTDADSELQDYPLSAAVFRDGVDGPKWIVDPDVVGGPEAPPAP